MKLESIGVAFRGGAAVVTVVRGAEVAERAEE